MHGEGGKIVLQFWHVGRISHASLLPDGAAPVSSTDRGGRGLAPLPREGFMPVSEPRALRDDEIPA